MSCYLPYCKSGYKSNKEKCHFFTAGKNDDLLKKWSEIILRKDKELFSTTRVCHKHFEEADILKNHIYTINGSEVKEPRARWELKPGSYPKLNLKNGTGSVLKEISSNPPVNILSPDKNKHNVSMILKDIVNAPKAKLIPYNATEGNELFTNSMKLSERLQSSSINETNSITMELVYQDIVKLYKTDEIPLPSKMWCVREVEGNLPSMSFIKFNKFEDSFWVLSKQVIFQSSTFATVYIRGKQFKSYALKYSCERIEDLLVLIRDVDGFNVCQGTKLTSVEDPELQPSFSEKCSLISNGKNHSCSSCLVLRWKLKKRNLKETQSQAKDILIDITALELDLQQAKLQLSNQEKEIEHLQIELLEASKKSSLEIIKDFSPKQRLAFATCIANAGKSPHAYRYNAEWLLECLLIKIKSAKTYEHLRKENILSLPHPKTLLKILRGLPCAFGVNEFALQSIAYHFDGLQRKYRMGAIVFDEMKLREAVCFNKDTHLFDGFVNYGEHTRSEDENKLADHALVFMFRPYNAKWVQPVAVFASRGAAPGTVLTKILISVLIHLEKANCEVCSVVCDGVSPNKTLWNQLGICGKKGEVVNKIPHPCDPDKRFLHFLIDFPHAIKCLRNYFMTHDIAKVKGETIQFTYYKTLLDFDESNTGLRFVKKLTKAHVNPNSFQKTNVKLAVQVFSRTVAKGLKFYRELGYEFMKFSKPTEDFTLLINDLFDIMNGKIPKHGLIPSSPKLRVIDEFLDILDETESQTPTRCFVSSVTGESFRVSLQSTKDLIQLLFDAGYEYVLTSKFNQDCLERFFGIVRMAGGGEEHPTVINFMALYRMLSVYTPTRRIQNGNCEADSEETVLVSYVDCLKAKSKEASHDRKSLSLNIEENILEKIWMNEDLPNCIDHNDYAKPSRDDCIIYHFCGYMLFKVKRFTQCKECIKTLSMNGIPPKESLLTDIVSYGFMKYVSLEMFSLFKEVERVINSEVNDGVISNLFWNVLDKIFIMSAPIGCNLHAEHLVPQLVHYFIVTRMHFIAREKNKKLSENKTRNARKKSKLC